MAGVALVFFVVLFFSLSSNSSQNYLHSVCSVLSSLCPKNVKIVNTQKSSSQNFSSKNAHELSKGHKKQRSFFHYEKPIIYNQSSSLVCAPFLHRLYLFIGCERERERERAGQRSPRDRARARGSNRKSNRLFSIDRFSSRARGVVPREKAAVRVDVGLSRLSYRSIARAFFLSSIGRK